MKKCVYSALLLLFWAMAVAVNAQTNNIPQTRNQDNNQQSDYFSQAVMFIEYGNYTEAAVVLGYAREQHERDPVLLLYSGYCSYKRGDYELSRAYLRDSLSIDNNQVVAYLLLGEMAKAQGDLITAVQYYEKALDYDNEIYVAHKALADILKGTDNQSADEHFLMCFQLHPEPLENYLPKAPKYTINRDVRPERQEGDVQIPAGNINIPVGHITNTNMPMDEVALTQSTGSDFSNAGAVLVPDSGSYDYEVERIRRSPFRKGMVIQKITQGIIVSIFLIALISVRKKYRRENQGKVLTGFFD